MSVNAHELLAAANKVLGYSDCEADHRGVMSRAYYAIYEDGRKFHEDLRSPGSLVADSRGGLHQNLLEQLKNPTIDKDSVDGRRSRRLGILMGSLHVLRVKADYNRSAVVSKIDAADSLAYAKSVLDILFPTQPPLGQIKPADISVSAAPVDDPAQSPARPTLKRIK